MASENRATLTAPVNADTPTTPVSQDIEAWKASHQISPTLQPGLEVWNPTSYPETVTHSTLESVPPSALESSTLSSLPYSRDRDPSLPPSTAVDSEYATFYNSPTVAPNELVLPSDEKRPLDNRTDGPSELELEKRRKKRRWIIVIAVIVTVAVITLAVVLGVVLGRKKSDNGSDGSDNSDRQRSQDNSKTPPPDPTGSPSAIRLRSGLGAAGWTTEKGYTIRLFFQDNSDYIRVSELNSWEKGWKGSALITKGSPGTSIAASHLLIDGFDQTNVYFLDGECIQEWAVIPNKPVTKGNVSEVCDAGNSKPHENSRLASYFPSLFFQDEEGRLSQYAYGQRRESKIYDWGSRPFENTAGYKSDRTGGKGTGLAMFPTSKDGSSLSTFYQNSDELLETFEMPKFSQQWEGGRDWVRGSNFSSIPPGAAIGGTSFLQSDGSLNLHILFQGEDGNIFQYYRQDGGLWIGPQPEAALKGALKDTEIACVSITPDPTSGELLRQPGLARCFFQLESGQVREIQAVENDNKGAWRVVGTVPVG